MPNASQHDVQRKDHDAQEITSVDAEEPGSACGDEGEDDCDDLNDVDSNDLSREGGDSAAKKKRKKKKASVYHTLMLRYILWAVQFTQVANSECRNFMRGPEFLTRLTCFSGL